MPRGSLYIIAHSKQSVIRYFIKDSIFSAQCEMLIIIIFFCHELEPRTVHPQVYDTIDGRPFNTLKGHRGTVYCLAYDTLGKVRPGIRPLGEDPAGSEIVLKDSDGTKKQRQLRHARGALKFLRVTCFDVFVFAYCPT